MFTFLTLKCFHLVRLLKEVGEPECDFGLPRKQQLAANERALQDVNSTKLTSRRGTNNDILMGSTRCTDSDCGINNYNTTPYVKQPLVSTRPVNVEWEIENFTVV